mmetsp:Transcript_4902/g.15911  ORF Transcript_4902/g.15911 Transcript_4902/m.15911 type:complete len:211 (+) Transcript_4902:713-1345(+)
MEVGEALLSGGDEIADGGDGEHARDADGGVEPRRHHLCQCGPAVAAGDHLADGRAAHLRGEGGEEAEPQRLRRQRRRQAAVLPVRRTALSSGSERAICPPAEWPARKTEPRSSRAAAAPAVPSSPPARCSEATSLTAARTSSCVPGKPPPPTEFAGSSCATLAYSTLNVATGPSGDTASTSAGGDVKVARKAAEPVASRVHSGFQKPPWR